MKKLILSIAAVVAFAFTTEAQTRKGTILLGAGSNLTETAWTDLQITPRVGFFVQDGVAIGAMVRFNNRSEDFTNDKTTGTADYTLSGSDMMLGAFVRYYVSNNVFAEVEIATESNKQESYDWITPPNNPLPPTANIQQVYEETESSTNFGLGLGYTIPFKEHFAIEPFVKLQFKSGDKTSYKVIQENDSKNKANYPDNEYRVVATKFNETNFN
ncbi:MAG: autotransporter outer membrane beta-barrel domain-containing protein, partial [Flavobacteriales bacterium]